MELFSDLTSALANLSSLSHQRKKLLIILGSVLFGMLILLGILSGAFIPADTSKTSTVADGPTPTETVEQKAELTPFPTDNIYANDTPEFLPTLTPTTTPYPGKFYIPNGQQNDLEIRYYTDEDGLSLEEVLLHNKKTTEFRTIGYMYYYAPGDSAFFSKDFSQVVFIGGNQTDYNAISFFSLPLNRVVKVITLSDLKKSLNIKTDYTAVLSSLVASPSKTKAALSYGNTFTSDTSETIDPNTYIIVISLTSNKMKLLPVKGRVKAWKDENILQYDVQSATGSAGFETKEVQVAGI